MKNHRVKVINKGEIYGDLTVIEDKYELSKNNKQSRALYKVKCICGKIFQAVGSNLRNGNTKRCKDCSFRLRSQNLMKPESLINQLFKRYVVYRSKYNNIELSIDKNDYYNIITKDCYYCGQPPEDRIVFTNRKYNHSGVIKINGIDRLDSNKGYILDNCVPCCTSCNYMKHVLSVNEFKNKIIKLYNNMNLKEF